MNKLNEKRIVIKTRLYSLMTDKYLSDKAIKLQDRLKTTNDKKIQNRIYEDSFAILEVLSKRHNNEYYQRLCTMRKRNYN